jgi:DNA repair protein RadA/Sms
VSKVKTLLACSACEHAVTQWVGRCPSCGEWGTIGERSPPLLTAAAPVLLGGGDDPEERMLTGFPGVDRVLGGGLVPGSVVLVAGEPGIGKSTLLLQILAAVGSSGQGSLLASGEESRAQVAARARRVGVPSDAVSFVPGRELPGVVGAARALRPSVLVVDSIQAIRDPEQPSVAGGPAQVRWCADALVGLAKEEGIAVLLAGQVTKDGEVAGPRTLEHAVDVVCSFDGDARTGLRVVAGGKNRFGPEGELAWFELGSGGLREVDPAGLLSAGRPEPGAARALVGAGRRALAVEVQALVVPTEGPPRRHVSGLDHRRFGQVAAVVERALGLGLFRAEIYGASAGGLRVDDPGADLAVAAALASAARGIPPPAGSAFVGEVGLTGGIRPTPGAGLRLAAAAAAGAETVFLAGEAEPPPGVRVIRVPHVRDALTWACSAEARAPRERVRVDGPVVRE